MIEGSEPKKPNVILTPDNRLRVFISSTLKELAEEREVVRQAVLQLRLLPVMFEAGARPHPAQELYQAYLAQSHVFIGIYWQSYGWLGPGMEISGLEDEFNRSSRLPRLIYVKSPAPDREIGLQRMLTRLEQEASASYKHFSSNAELADLVQNDLALLLSESYYESLSQAPAAEFAPRPLTNIPFPRNPLLGRTGELETVCSWLSQDDVGMVTLTGAGGTGKSRLALEAALKLRDRFSDGVYLVRLSPVSDPERVIPTIAETLGVRQSGQSGPVEEILTNYLHGRRTLLVLDNFEQVLAAARNITKLLETCPSLKVLVTSRAPLRVRGEKELLVNPLPVPNLKHAPDPGQLSQYASVELFIQRAQGVRPDFQVTNENAPAVAEICSRLDGLPLAIELAAARIKLLSPDELLIRLSHRFELLRGGMRDLPERQQTLRGAIDWSYNLLADPARAIFRRLSVFSGGFSMEAAEAVCTLQDGSDPPVLEQIEVLVDSSLLTPFEGLEGHLRFGMLETIREYAAERLTESGEAGRLRRGHAEYFLHLAGELEPRIRTAERVRWRAILEQDLENLRGALGWAPTEADGLEIGQQLAITLGYFWALCGHQSEGQHYCDTFRDPRYEKTPAPIRVGLVNVAGTISLLQGSPKISMSDWVGSIALARRSGQTNILATALLIGGAWALAGQDLALAAQRLEECQRMFHELGDEWSEVLSILWLSNTVALGGERERSAALFDRAFSLARRLGDPWLLVVPLIDVAQNAFASGDLGKAETTLLEVESMLRAVDDPWGLGWPLGALAHIQLMRGDLPSARSRIAEALQLGREYGNMIVQNYSVVETACALALRYGSEGTAPDLRQLKLTNAARLCGATRHFVDYPILLGSLSTRDIYEGMVTLIHSRIEPEIWEPGYQEGASMRFEEALDIAAAELGQALD